MMVGGEYICSSFDRGKFYTTKLYIVETFALKLLLHRGFTSLNKEINSLDSVLTSHVFLFLQLSHVFMLFKMYTVCK
jgi:hypothetical protein